MGKPQNKLTAHEPISDPHTPAERQALDKHAKKQKDLIEQFRQTPDGMAVDAYVKELNLQNFITERIGEADDGEALRINRWGSEYGPKWEDYRIQIIGTVLQIFDQPKTIEPFEFDFPCTIIDSVKLVKIQRIRLFHRGTGFYCDAPYTGTSFDPSFKGSGDVWRQGQMAIDKQIKLLRRGLALLGMIGLKRGRKKGSQRPKDEWKITEVIDELEEHVERKIKSILKSHCDADITEMTFERLCFSNSRSTVHRLLKKGRNQTLRSFVRSVFDRIKNNAAK